MRVGEGVRQQQTTERIEMRLELEEAHNEIRKQRMLLNESEKEISQLREEIATLRRRLRHRGGHQTH